MPTELYAGGKKYVLRSPGNMFREPRDLAAPAGTSVDYLAGKGDAIADFSEIDVDRFLLTIATDPRHIQAYVTEGIITDTSYEVTKLPLGDREETHRKFHLKTPGFFVMGEIAPGEFLTLDGIERYYGHEIEGNVETFFTEQDLKDRRLYRVTDDFLLTLLRHQLGID
jgi:hypothetical protein|tara:strand:- start:38 stop:541 length:504 start_codon:yes stop_codon:yes gene_type:complete